MRTEHDSLGDLQIPDDEYFGIQTARALDNFSISDLQISPYFIRAYAELKKACTMANVELGAFKNEAAANAIIKACDEVAELEHEKQFILDVFQAGAGTSTNMNLNEVIANRALEILGKPRGDYATISPNDHVNMSQSTNDTYPTAMRLAAILMLHEQLHPALAALGSAFTQKGEEFADFVKSGRTHLQDAVPITLGQEFTAWAHILFRHFLRLLNAEEDLNRLGIGGSAAGSGLNTPKGYTKLVVATLVSNLGIKLYESENLFEAMQSLAPFVHLMSALKNLSLDLLKISADLRLLASGPMTGLAEIQVPAVQPGSSIMPGKVNPSMLEMLSQVALQVVGSEATVAMASQAGQLELNVMMPIVQFNICFSLEILSNAMGSVSEKCIVGITADRERMLHYAETSGSLVTALAPEIGYLKAAEVAKESLRTKRPIREIVLEQKLVQAEKLENILDVFEMTGAKKKRAVRKKPAKKA